MSSYCFSQQVLVAGKGASSWKIYPDPSSPANIQAGKVLQDYFYRVTGVKLPIVGTIPAGNREVFLLGTQDKESATLRNEGFIIRSGKDHVAISGREGKSVLYGVYAFIEKYLGCRKPSAGAAIVPVKEQVWLPALINERSEPQLVYREAYFPPSFEDEYLDWHGLHRFEDRWGLWGHSFFKLVSPNLYFKKHPEYFSLVNGKREPVQLCLSNAMVLRITIQELRRRIEEEPGRQYWSVSPNDDNGYCECGECSRVDKAEGGPQGSLIRFVNAVAAQFPGKTITTLAYGYTAAAPLKTRPAQNVTVMLSTIDAFRTKPLAEEKTAAGFRKNLRDWREKTEHIFIWDYCTQFTNYLAPFPVENNFAADISFFIRNGVTGIFSQGSGNTYSDMAEMKSYLLAKFLWNTATKESLLADEFAGIYYGKAAEQVIAMLRSMRSQVHMPLDIYGNPVNAHTDYLSPAAIDGYSQLMDEAERLAGGNAGVLQHIRQLRLSQEYVVLQQALFFGKDRHGLFVNNGNGDFVVRPGLRKRVQSFVNDCRINGVKELSEGGITPAVYEQQWEKILHTGPAHNLAANTQVQLSFPYAPEFPSKKERTLVDETPGYDDFSYNWLCFYGTPMEAVVDMGVLKPVQSIRLNFLEDARHWIFRPSRVQIETSIDGIVYTQAAMVNLPPPEEAYTIGRYPVRFEVKGSYRYIRVHAANQPALPGWRYHRSKKPMIACDEIWVE